MVTFTNRKTKTWPRRHENKISKLVEILSLWEVHDPVVLQVGPGGIAYSHAHLFPHGPEDKMSWKDRKILQFASMREAGERDKERAKLATYETREIYEALQSSIGLSRMYVIDTDLRVLEAVQKLNLPKTILLPHNISNGPVYYDSQLVEADVGIAYKVIEYNVGKKERVIASLHNSVKKDRGFLGMTLPGKNPSVPVGLTQLAYTVYLNGQRGDKKHRIMEIPRLDVAAIERAAKTRYPA